MALAYPRRALAGTVASLAAAACLALNSAAAQADQIRNQEWWLKALHVTQAWQSSRGADVTVAVLSTGVDAQQPDLVGSVITGPDYTASGRMPGGPYWGLSGTATASLIAGHGHGPGRADGVIGVAPAAKILSIRVTLESDDPLLADSPITGTLPDAIAHGIRYAVRHHAGVIDLPLDPVTTLGAAGAGGSRAERSAVAYALAHHVVLVAPAGDDGQGIDAVNFPAAYPGVISVGAFDSNFIKAPFSSQQPYVTLTAAGANVVAAQPQGSYAAVNSTSAASAVVAGIAALIRAQFPQLTPAQVEQALTKSTVYRRPGGQSHGSGHGTADAARALSAAAGIVEAPNAPSSAGPTASAAQAAPMPPPIHGAKSPSLGQLIGKDAGVAGGLFLVLLVAILGFGWLQRRRARSARLADVRAAARVPVRPLRQTPTPIDGVAAQVSGARASAYSGDAADPGSAVALAGAVAPRPGSALTGSAAAKTDDHDLAPWEVRPEGPVTATAFQNTLFARSVGGDGASPGAAAISPGDAFAGGDRTETAGTTPAPGPGRPGPGGHGPARPVITGTVIGGDRGAPAGSGAGAVGGAGGGAGSGASGIAAMRTLGSHRAPTRSPRVSGTPPWDAAAQPDGEVPWARSPSPGGPSAEGVGGLPERRQRSGLSVWDVIAEEVWPGGPRSGSGSGSGSAKPDPRAAGPSPEPSGTEPGSGADGAAGSPPRPIYIWNPGATTETFPAIQPDAGGA